MDLLELIKVIKELNASMIQLRAEIVGLSRELAAVRLQKSMQKVGD